MSDRPLFVVAQLAAPVVIPSEAKNLLFVVAACASQ